MATSYLSPGVYIEGSTRGSKPSRQSGLRLRHSLASRRSGPTKRGGADHQLGAVQPAPRRTSRTRPCSRTPSTGLNNGAPSLHLQRLSQDGDGGSSRQEAEKKEAESKKAGEGGKPAAAPSAAPVAAVPSPALYSARTRAPDAARA